MWMNVDSRSLQMLMVVSLLIVRVCVRMCGSSRSKGKYYESCMWWRARASHPLEQAQAALYVPKSPAHVDDPICMMSTKATPNSTTLVGAVSRDAWERGESCAQAEAKQG